MIVSGSGWAVTRSQAPQSQHGQHNTSWSLDNLSALCCGEATTSTTSAVSYLIISSYGVMESILAWWECAIIWFSSDSHDGLCQLVQHNWLKDNLVSYCLPESEPKCLLNYRSFQLKKCSIFWYSQVFCLKVSLELVNNWQSKSKYTTASITDMFFLLIVSLVLPTTSPDWQWGEIQYTYWQYNNNRLDNNHLLITFINWLILHWICFSKHLIEEMLELRYKLISRIAG